MESESLAQDTSHRRCCMLTIRIPVNSDNYRKVPVDLPIAYTRNFRFEIHDVENRRCLRTMMTFNAQTPRPDESSRAGHKSIPSSQNQCQIKRKGFYRNAFLLKNDTPNILSATETTVLKISMIGQSILTLVRGMYALYSHSKIISSRLVAQERTGKLAV